MLSKDLDFFEGMLAIFFELVRLFCAIAFLWIAAVYALENAKPNAHVSQLRVYTWNLQVQSLEEKVKKVGSELECQRHNAQAAQLTWEQKVKEKDKEHKAEQSQQNDILRDMERQLDENKKRSEQEMNKVTWPFKVTPEFKACYFIYRLIYCCQFVAVK